MLTRARAASLAAPNQRTRAQRRRQGILNLHSQSNGSAVSKSRHAKLRRPGKHVAPSRSKSEDHSSGALSRALGDTKLSSDAEATDYKQSSSPAIDDQPMALSAAAESDRASHPERVRNRKSRASGQPRRTGRSLKKQLPAGDELLKLLIAGPKYFDPKVNHSLHMRSIEVEYGMERSTLLKRRTAAFNVVYGANAKAEIEKDKLLRKSVTGRMERTSRVNPVNSTPKIKPVNGTSTVRPANAEPAKPATTETSISTESFEQTWIAQRYAPAVSNIGPTSSSAHSSLSDEEIAHQLRAFLDAPIGPVNGGPCVLSQTVCFETATLPDHGGSNEANYQHTDNNFPSQDVSVFEACLARVGEAKTPPDFATHNAYDGDFSNYHIANLPGDIYYQQQAPLQPRLFLPSQWTLHTDETMGTTSLELRDLGTSDEGELVGNGVLSDAEAYAKVTDEKFLQLDDDVDSWFYLDLSLEDRDTGGLDPNALFEADFFELKQ